MAFNVSSTGAMSNKSDDAYNASDEDVQYNNGMLNDEMVRGTSDGDQASGNEFPVGEQLEDYRELKRVLGRQQRRSGSGRSLRASVVGSGYNLAGFRAPSMKEAAPLVEFVCLPQLLQL